MLRRLLGLILVLVPAVFFWGVMQEGLPRRHVASDGREQLDEGVWEGAQRFQWQDEGELWREDGTSCRDAVMSPRDGALHFARRDEGGWNLYRAALRGRGVHDAEPSLEWNSSHEERSPAFSSDGLRAVFLRKTGGLWRLFQSEWKGRGFSEPTQLDWRPGPGEPRSPWFTDDGRLHCLLRDPVTGSMKLAAVDLDDREGTSQVLSLAWPQDLEILSATQDLQGRALYVSARLSADGDFDLYRVLLEGDAAGQLRELRALNTDDDECDPRWGPDGRLYFTRSGAGGRAVDFTVHRARLVELDLLPVASLFWDRMMRLAAALVALLLLGILAWRWHQLHPFLKFVLISILVHLFLLLYLRPLAQEPAEAGDGDASGFAVEYVQAPRTGATFDRAVVPGRPLDIQKSGRAPQLSRVTPPEEPHRSSSVARTRQMPNLSKTPSDVPAEPCRAPAERVSPQALSLEPLAHHPGQGRPESLAEENPDPHSGRLAGPPLKDVIPVKAGKLKSRLPAVEPGQPLAQASVQPAAAPVPDIPTADSLLRIRRNITVKLQPGLVQPVASSAGAGKRPRSLADTPLKPGTLAGDALDARRRQPWQRRTSGMPASNMLPAQPTPSAVAAAGRRAATVLPVRPRALPPVRRATGSNTLSAALGGAKKTASVRSRPEKLGEAGREAGVLAGKPLSLPRAPATARLVPASATFDPIPRQWAGTPLRPQPSWGHEQALPGVLGARRGAARALALRLGGGGVKTEAAVLAGLRYLKKRQRPDGAWGSARMDAKYDDRRAGKTGLALLAFLGSGFSHKEPGEFQDTIRRGLGFLRARQGEGGHIGQSSSYGHGIATYALAEACAMTRDDDLREPLRAAVRRIIRAQKRHRDPRLDGGWSYYYANPRRTYDAWPRLSVTVWQIMALKSARLAGVQVPQTVLDRARNFVLHADDEALGALRYNHDPSWLRSGNPTLPGSSAAGLFALQLFDVAPHDPVYQRALNYVRQRPPTWRWRRSSARGFVQRAEANLYFHYYAALALHRHGGDVWETWNALLKPLILDNQQADGSWRPISHYATQADDIRGDRSYTTAMSVLILEVYYRYFTPLTARHSQGAPGEQPVGTTVRAAGVTVVSVRPNGSASRLGMRPGDRILAVNGEVVRHSGDLRHLLRSWRRGSRGTLTLWREGRRVSLVSDRRPGGFKVKRRAGDSSGDR